MKAPPQNRKPTEILLWLRHCLEKMIIECLHACLYNNYISAIFYALNSIE